MLLDDWKRIGHIIYTCDFFVEKVFLDAILSILSLMLARKRCKEKTGVDCVILSGIHDYYEPEELVGKTAIAIVNVPPRKMMGINSEGMLISAIHEEDGHEGLNLLMVDDKIFAGAKLY